MISKQSLILQTVNILVRSLEIIDVTDEYIAGLNDPDVNQYLVAVGQHRQTTDSVTNYVEADWNNPLSILFILFFSEPYFCSLVMKSLNSKFELKT